MAGSFSSFITRQALPGSAPPLSSASALAASPSMTAAASGVRPRLSGLSAHLPKARSSSTPAASRYMTAVIRSAYRGPGAEGPARKGVAVTGTAATLATGGGGGAAFAAGGGGGGGGGAFATATGGFSSAFGTSLATAIAGAAGFAGVFARLAGNGAGISPRTRVKG